VHYGESDSGDKQEATVLRFHGTLALGLVSIRCHRQQAFQTVIFITEVKLKSFSPDF